MQLTEMGIIHTALTDSHNAPIQPAASQVKGYVDVKEQYRDGLQDLDGFERIWLVFWCHKARSAKMTVVPYMDTVPHGVFATRAPSRPNPIGMSCVKLERIEGARLYIAETDILDGTPLLDIKPYVTKFDNYPNVRCGWVDKVDAETVKQGKADQRFQQ